MTRTMTPYVVRQGDYLAKLAYVRGFDADAVWNDPKNEEIKTLRPDPSILAPGDIVYLPGNEAGDGQPVAGGTENTYAATVPTVEIAVVLRDEGGQPLADEPYEIHGLGDPSPATTGPDGAVTITVPVLTREVTLVLTQRGLVYQVGVGDLDPLVESSGACQRLVHLGWLHPLATQDREAVASAIAAFQMAQGIEETGMLDTATREALKTAHGS